jgi:hypothetical protein
MIVAFTAWAAQPRNMFPLMIGKLSQNRALYCRVSCAALMEGKLIVGCAGGRGAGRGLTARLGTCGPPG